MKRVPFASEFPRSRSAVDAGDVLVKIPRETAKQKDITGGLPRVVELFEARRPKEPAVITEVNGLVKFGDVTKSHRKVLVVTPDGEEHEYQLPRGAHVNVREGEAVPQGEAFALECRQTFTTGG